MGSYRAECELRGLDGEAEVHCVEARSSYYNDHRELESAMSACLN